MIELSPTARYEIVDSLEVLGIPGLRQLLPLTRLVILLHPPPPLVGISVGMEREPQQNNKSRQWL